MDKALTPVERSRYIIARLRDGPDPVSGETLAAELGISRVALWKRIESLRSWGYRIESSHAGYRLQRDDGLSVWDITVPGSLFLFDELASTMDEAHARALAGAPDGSLVLALRQHAGRKLDGGLWPSPDGGLYASLIVRCAIPVHFADAFLMEAMSVMVRLLASALPERAPYFVWPHSIYTGKRKIAGMLLEMKGRPAAPDYWVLGFSLVAPGDENPAAVWPARASLCSALVAGLMAWAADPQFDQQRWRGLLRPGLRLSVAAVAGGSRIVNPVGFLPSGGLLLDDGSQLTISQCLKSEYLPDTDN